MTILVVESEIAPIPFVEELLRGTREPIAMCLTSDDVSRKIAESAATVVIVCEREWTDAATEACRRIYVENGGTRVLALAGPVDASVRVAALAAGADDFIALPIAADEILARVRAVARRAQPPSTVSAGPFVLDRVRQLLFVDGRAVHLTRREYEIVDALVASGGALVTRDDLIARVSREPRSRSNWIEVYVNRIRSKLGERAGALVTVRGAGYRLRRRG